MLAIRESGYWFRCIRATMVVALGTILGTSPTVLAVDEATQLSKLVPSDGIANDQAANSVAVSGNFAVIGAANAWRSSLSSFDPRGAAYVYRYNGITWSQSQKLVASDAALSDRFGWAVTMSADTIFVGSPYDDNERGTDAGSVYVFRYNGSTWVQTQRLFASDGLGGDSFGNSVATNGSFLFVSATGNDQAGTNAGALYVFRFNGTSWAQAQKILPTDTTGFGYPVAASGDFAIVGNASNTNANGTQAGAAYAYRYNGSSWVFVQKILPSDGRANQNFGFSVSVSSSLALIGARYDNDRGNMAGAAYVFRFNTSNLQWAQETKLVDLGPQAPFGQPGNQFGWSVGISGTTAVVGSPWWDDQEMQFPLQDQGAGHVFTYQSATQQWLLQKRIVASDGYVSDNLGKSIAISGNFIVAGAQLNDARAMDSGAGYTFRAGCVSNAGCDDGNACTNDVCNSDGTCSNPAKANGTACPDDGNVCSNDVCSSGVCTHPAKANGTACTADTNSCTNDVCSAGVCTHPYKPAGSACGSSSASLCDDPDTCSSSGVCLTNNLPTGTACQDDGNQCTRDYCVSGSCVHPNNPNGWACNDGNANTSGDQCLSGVCTGTPITSGCTSNSQCEDGNPCTTDTCSSGVCQRVNNTNSCTDDGNSCTNDVCSGGACTHPAKPNGTTCSADTNSCTNDVCSAGVCTHPLKPAGSACGSSASSLCDDPDSCSSSGVCLTNTLPNGTACLDDGNECTRDYCSSGSCIHPAEAVGTPCDDGNALTIGDQCNSSGTCIGGTQAQCGTNADCNDNNVCTTDSCVSGQCQRVNNNVSCNDGLWCNGSDACNNGTCSLHSGDPCPGPDGDNSCTESCNESLNNCTARDPDESSCSDGNAVTLGDYCYAGICLPGENPACKPRNQACSENWECCSGSCGRNRKCR